MAMIHEKTERLTEHPQSCRIVHLTTGHDAFDVRVFQKECSSLSNAGYDVVLVAPHERDQLAGRVRVKAIPMRAGRWYRFTVGVWHACRETLRENAILYHFHDPELVPAGVLFRLLGRRVVYDVHDDLPGTFIDKDYIPEWLREPMMKLARFLEDAAAARFSAIITATPSIGKDFCESTGAQLCSRILFYLKILDWQNIFGGASEN